MSKYNSLIRGLRILEEFDVEDDDAVRIEGGAIRAGTVVGVHGVGRLERLGWVYDVDAVEWVLKFRDEDAD